MRDRADMLLTQTLDLAKAGKSEPLDLLQPGGQENAVIRVSTGPIACTAAKKLTITLEGALTPDAETWTEIASVALTGDESGQVAPVLRESRCPYGGDVQFIRLSAAPGTGATVTGTAKLQILV